MFGKNKKTDSKIRFQQTGFRRQLQSARGYKRQGIVNPKPKHFWPKLIVGAAVVLILYLVYIPNFLFVKRIQVNGISGDGQQQIINLAQAYLKLKPLTAQGNWWLLSAQKLSSYILAHDDQILAVNSVSKKFPNKLVVTVTPRTLAFNVTLPLQHLLVSNDGLVEQDVSSFGTSTMAQATNLIGVDIASATPASLGDKFLPSNLIDSLNLLNDLTKTTLKLPLDHFELPSTTSTDISEYLTGGYELKFNSSMNLNQAVNQAALIINSLADNQKKNLYYIDMRFEGKGFTCYKNSPCQ